MKDYYLALQTYQEAKHINHPDAETYLKAINKAYRRLAPWERRLIALVAERGQQS